MAHQWTKTRHRFSTYRECKRCGLMQQFSSGSRGIRYRPGGWFPKVGRCGRVNLKLHRANGGYETEDGLFRVIQEPRENGDFGCPRRWFVNHKDYDETLNFQGFRTKTLAVEWLRRNAAEFLE